MFFGGEGRCEDFYDNSGALFELAPKLGALVIFLEHRCGSMRSWMCAPPSSPTDALRTRAQWKNTRMKTSDGLTVRRSIQAHDGASSHWCLPHLRSSFNVPILSLFPRGTSYRYYGDSLPFPTAAESYSNEGLRYLTVEQALADMSDVLSLKQPLLNCSGTGS